MATTTNPVTLFTGQWADLTLDEVAGLAAGWGYDGLEIACSAEHLDVWRAAEDDAYLRERRDILDRHGLRVWALSNHLTGQAVCDGPIDFRHQAIVRPRVWGDGDPEGVRRRAADELRRTAIVARKLGAEVVTGFTGSSIWPYVARFAHEVHPAEIAYDHWTCVRALDAIGHRAAFGFNWDPSHMMWQGIDTAGFIVDFADRIHHVDCKDTRVRPATGRAGVLGSHLPWGDPRRGWDFVSTGHGDVPWEDAFRALRGIGYRGPISVEWEDAGMDRRHGAAEAVGVVRSLLWDLPETSFDAAFARNAGPSARD